MKRYKVRLVEQWFTQTEGLDYFETFSPIAKMTTVRVILALTSIKGWHVHQLHGDLKEGVYMKFLKGFNHPSQAKFT